jgi:hypothetical protein
LTILISGRLHGRAHEMAAAYDDANGITEPQAAQIQAAAPGADIRYAGTPADLRSTEEAEVVFARSAAALP